MKNLLLLLTALLLLNCGGGDINFNLGPAVSGEGPTVKKTIELAPFHSVNLASSIDVTIHKGDQQKVEVEGQQNLIELLNTEVNDQEWMIIFEKSVKNVKGFKVHITLPELRNANVSGSGDLNGTSDFSTESKSSLSVSGSGNLSFTLNAPEIVNRVSGSGNLNLTTQSNDIKASIQGSGTVRIIGNTRHFEGNISGSGDLECRELKTETAEVKIGGSGDCEINASKSLNASIAGSGDIHYLGNPVIQSSTLGSGKVRPL